jgi:hypothetical protein
MDRGADYNARSGGFKGRDPVEVFGWERQGAWDFLPTPRGKMGVCRRLLGEMDLTTMADTAEDCEMAVSVDGNGDIAKVDIPGTCSTTVTCQELEGIDRSTCQSAARHARKTIHGRGVRV